MARAAQISYQARMTDGAPHNLTLTTNDILGIIQRGLMELHGYCGQHPHAVDPAVCMAYLERMASFVGKLPAIQLPAMGSDGPDKRQGKAN